MRPTRCPVLVVVQVWAVDVARILWEHRILPMRVPEHLSRNPISGA
jgi:hypothetical protein